MKKSLVTTLISLAVVVTLSACQSAKKEENTAAAPDANAAPQIENTPMSFDPSGSDSGKIAGLETVFFEYDKAILSASAKKKLQANAEWMKTNSKVNMQIEGHCDTRGSIEYNLSLGERRAKAVKSYMVTLGVPAGRMNIISYGKEKLLVQGDGESAHSKNRRANFVPLQ